MRRVVPLLVLVLVPPVLGKCSEKPAVQRENRRRRTTFTGGHSIFFRSIGSEYSGSVKSTVVSYHLIKLYLTTPFFLNFWK